MARDTQVLKVLRNMARTPSKEWWYAPDFQRPNMPSDLYVGYEATARISDVIREYPSLLDVKRDGRFRYVKLRPTAEFSDSVPSEIVSMIKRERREGQYDGRNY